MTGEAVRVDTQARWANCVYRGEGKPKFWRVRRLDQVVEVWYGPEGRSGKARVKACKSAAEAERYLLAQQKRWLSKGYEELESLPGEEIPEWLIGVARFDALEEACVMHDREVFFQLLSSTDTSPDFKHPQENVPILHVAIQRALDERGVEIVRLLLDAGASIDLRDDRGNTVMHAASENFTHCGRSLMRLFVERGLAVNPANDEGVTPWMIVSYRWDADVRHLALLLELGVDINTQDTRRSTALHAAVAHGDTERMRFLLDHGARCDVRDSDGDTPLSLARRESKKPYADAALKVLELLQSAGTEEQREIIDEVLELLAVIRQPPPRRHEIVNQAIYDGDLRTVLEFLEDGINPNAPCGDGVRPMDAARRGKMPHIEAILREWGGEDTKPSMSSESGISTAITNMLERAVGDCANLDLRLDAPREEPESAVLREATDRFLELIMHPADAACVQRVKLNGSSVLTVCAESRRFELVKALLETLPDPRLDEALKAALRVGDARIVELLLAHGADPQKGLLELHLSSPRLDVVERLLEAGASVLDAYKKDELMFSGPHRNRTIGLLRASARGVFPKRWTSLNVRGGSPVGDIAHARGLSRFTNHNMYWKDPHSCAAVFIPRPIAVVTPCFADIVGATRVHTDIGSNLAPYARRFHAVVRFHFNQWTSVIVDCSHRPGDEDEPRRIGSELASRLGAETIVLEGDRTYEILPGRVPNAKEWRQPVGAIEEREDGSHTFHQLWDMVDAVGLNAWSASKGIFLPSCKLSREGLRSSVTLTGVRKKHVERADIVVVEEDEWAEHYAERFAE